MTRTHVPQLALVVDPASYTADRAAWKASAARVHFGVCGCCGRHRDANGERLLVARQERARRFLCFDCARPAIARKCGARGKRKAA